MHIQERLGAMQRSSLNRIWATTKNRKTGSITYANNQHVLELQASRDTIAPMELSFRVSPLYHR